MTVRRISRGQEREALRRLSEISGQNVYRCMQCGTCTAVCPMSGDMDITPRQALLLLQHQIVAPVRESRTPTLCASCHACQVRCPRSIEVPRVMEALRQLVLRDNIDLVHPRQVPVEELRDMPQMGLVACFRKLTA